MTKLSLKTNQKNLPLETSGKFIALKKSLNYRKKITSIILLCIASQFSCVTNDTEVIDAIAIPALFNHSILQKLILELKSFQLLR